MTMQPEARCAFHWRFEEVPRRLNRFRSKPRLCQERETSHSHRLSRGCVGRGYDAIGTPISMALKGADTSAIGPSRRFVALHIILEFESAFRELRTRTDL